MKILLTGGAGFIGSHLLERLVERGDEIVVVDDFNDFYDPAIKRRNIAGTHARIVETDLRNTEALEPLFRGGFDLLIHLAARAGVRASLEDPLLYADVNVQGTLGLFELCRRHNVPRVVFASSSSVYGNAPAPFREDCPDLSPISPYGASKLAGEQYARVYHRLNGLKITSLRFFTVYGPRQRPDMAIHKFTRLIDAGEEIPMFGTGTTRRDYTYIDDIVHGVLRAVDTPEDFALYNLAESRTIELRPLIALIEEALGKRARIRELPEQPGDVKQTNADISLAQERLDYDPSVPIEEGVQRFVEWYRALPE